MTDSNCLNLKPNPPCPYITCCRVFAHSRRKVTITNFTSYYFTCSVSAINSELINWKKKKANISFPYAWKQETVELFKFLWELFCSSRYESWRLSCLLGRLDIETLFQVGHLTTQDQKMFSLELFWEAHSLTLFPWCPVFPNTAFNIVFLTCMCMGVLSAWVYAPHAYSVCGGQKASKLELQMVVS